MVKIIDFDIVFDNILTLGALFGVGYLIYQGMKGNNALIKLKGRFSKVFEKTRLR